MLGERIRQAREAACMSQKDIADGLRISRNAVSLWESEQTAPEASRISPLAVMLGVTTDWLLTGEGDAPAWQPRTKPEGYITGTDVDPNYDEIIGRLFSLSVTHPHLGTVKMAAAIATLLDENRRLRRNK